MSTIETPAAGMSPLPAAGTKPLPPHGSLHRAMGNRRKGWARCHCLPCRITERRYTKHRAYLANSGNPLTVDATAAREHILKLRASGEAIAVMARTYRIPRRTLNRLVKGDLQRIQRRTEDAILAIRPGTAVNLYQSVPAVAATRRIRALFAAGHTLAAVTEITGIKHNTASILVNGHQGTIRYELNERMRKGYDELASSRGGSVRNLRRAEREGWPDPLWWEDMGHIDDPDFDPAAVKDELSRNEEAAVRRGEIEHLMSYGLDHEAIAGRMDMHPTTVRNIMNELRSGRRRVRGTAA